MEPGEVVAERFEILGSAGSGGMGVVYRALDRSTGSTVALKLLHATGLASGDRFAREALALAGLQHPGIVRHVAHGTTADGRQYLAMEWLEGCDLAQRLTQGPLDVKESVALARRVAESLASAHAQGILHRDVKPRNLFLVDGDLRQVKLLDFGLARLGDQLTALTRTGLMVGTPGYGAPEQARGTRDIGPPADVFALGCVLWKCLTGRAAFVGEDLVAVLAKVLFEDAAPASELRPEVPAELDDLLARMMAKDSAARPRDGAAVAAELAALEARIAVVGLPRASTATRLAQSEQRIVSVVVADVAGRGPDDPTLTHEALAEIETTSSRVREVVQPLGASFEALPSGCAVATLTGQASATDQAARAARCALAIRAVAPAAVIAVTTGRGVLGKTGAIGEVIDRAVELVRTAHGAAGIRVDDTTAGLLDARFDLGGGDPTEHGSASGTLLLLGERAAKSPIRLLLGKPTPCVGRDRELRTLEAIYDECAEERVPRVVVVTAPAGVGKSRLRYELVGRLRERPRLQIWIARGDPMSAGSPLGTLGELVRGAAGVLDGEPLVVRQRKLRARLSRHFDGAELARMTEFVGELAQIPAQRDPSGQLRAARRDAMLMGDQMRRAWEDLLRAECADGPLLVLLEDLQWSDLSTIRFIDSALRGLVDAPVMVLALARPEVHELFPKLWSERALTEMRLTELSAKASDRLVRTVLGETATDEVVSRIVQRAQGNAFYLEELIRSVNEGRGDGPPGSVLAMIQARLERLEADARRALSAGSVFGQAFWSGGVVALLGGPAAAGDVDTWLTELAARELVTHRPEARFPGHNEYTFRHAFVREAAYRILTEDNRKVGHRLAGEWLERVGAPDAILLGEHFERGGLPERAVGWYRRAAEQALSGNDFAAAIERADRGAACGASGSELGALRLVQSEAHGWRAEFDRAERLGREAMQLLPRASEAWYAAAGEVARATGRLANVQLLPTLADELTTPDLEGDGSSGRVVVLARIAISLFILGGYEKACALLERCERFLPELAKDPVVLARLQAAQAIRALLDGDPVGYLELSRRATASFEEAGDERDATLQRHNVGSALLELGGNEAETVLREAYAASERLGLNHLASGTRINIAMALTRASGRLDEARALLDATLEDFRVRTERRLEAYAHAYLALVHQLCGSYAAMKDEAERAVAIAPDGISAQFYALGMLAAAHLACGEPKEALTQARRAMSLLDQLGAVEAGESIVRLAYAEALDAAGEEGAARAAYASARNRLLERAAKVKDPTWRESFLTKIPENARTLARVEERLGVGG